MSLSCCLGCGDGCVLCCWERCFAPSPRDVATIDFKTGDVLLFQSSPEGRVSGINCLAAAPWDHVGLVYCHEGVTYCIDSGSWRYFPDITRRPLCWDGEDDAAWRAAGSGPQMYPLAQFLERISAGLIEPPADKPGKRGYTYERIGVRRLSRALSGEEKASLDAQIRLIRDAPYETDSGEMTNSLIDCCCFSCFSNKEETLNQVFCSELTAALLKSARLLPEHPPSSEYVPSDFARDHGCNFTVLCGLCCCQWMLRRCCCPSPLAPPKGAEPCRLLPEQVFRLQVFRP